jgi:peptidylprolyl isomerase
MVTGEKRRFWIPEELAYADEANRPQGMLVFDIELISFVQAPETPPNLAEPPEGAVRTESGLAYEILREGSGERPGPEDMLLVELNVWTPEGSLYDSSVLHGKPFNFRIDLTVPAFQELLPGMSRGGKWMIWSPEEMARLDDDSVVEGPMVFEIELLDFFSRPETPPDLVAPPPNAERSVTGLAWRVLQPGSGDRRPRAGERVEVEYAGWTRDGKMFDSSFDHGQPGVFTLGSHMPRGWNEALKMMVVGEKRRIWIPEELAYAGQKNRPEGMLIFDVELLSIKEPEPEPDAEPPAETGS